MELERRPYKEVLCVNVLVLGEVEVLLGDENSLCTNISFLALNPLICQSLIPQSSHSIIHL